MRKLFIVLICAVFFPVSLFGKAADIDLPRLIKICESYQNAVKDVNIEYSDEYKQPCYKDARKRDLKIISEKAHFIGIKPFSFFYNIEQLITTEDILWHRKETLRYQAWDGNSFLCSEPEPQKSYLYMETPLEFTHFFQVNERRTLLNILKDSDYKNILDPNVKKINDFNAIEVACYYVNKNESFLVRKFYFSINHNYTIVKIIDGVRHPAIFNVLQLKNLGNGIWFPIQTFYKYEGFEVKTDVNKVSINQGLTSKNLINRSVSENGTIP